ncbi:MAG: SMP-30/gluconolactonase/LRE family protein [Haloarculaceae archaeon]
MDATVPDLVADVACGTGENPLWHPEEELLYWADIPAGRVYTYDPAADDYELLYEDPEERIGGFTFEEDGALLLFQEAGAVRRYEDGTVETVVAPDPDEFDERFNDVIADPEGRVYCGVMPDPDNDVPGALYRLDHDGTFECIEPEVGLPNGMDFTEDLSTMYFTDSCAHDDRPGIIYRYDYDRATGELSNRETVIESHGMLGFNDGMTLDEDDHIWSAYWGGHGIVRFAPDGTRERTVRIGPPKVSSLTFGGPDLDQAYVTTAAEEGRLVEGDSAGSLFRVDLEIGGRPEFYSSIATE